MDSQEPKSQPTLPPQPAFTGACFGGNCIDGYSAYPPEEWRQVDPGMDAGQWHRQNRRSVLLMTGEPGELFRLGARMSREYLPTPTETRKGL